MYKQPALLLHHACAFFQGTKRTRQKFRSLVLKFLLSINLLLIGINGYTQNIPSTAPNVIPPSPEAQAFQRYGEYPVDYSTGIPKIDIPLYEIHSGKLSLPVSLSYHASGIKLNDIATVVGLGWTLKAGGMVSRSVRGIPDEGPGYNYLSMVHKTQSDIDAATQDGNLFQYLNLIRLNTYDSESDNYFYSAGEKLSGQFVYDLNNNILPLSYTESKISRNLSANSFDIIGDDGTDYQFAQVETQTATGINGTYTSSWWLTQMVSYDKADTIKFEYNSVVTGGDDLYRSYSQEYGSGVGQAPYTYPLVWQPLRTIQSGVSYVNTVLLTKIDFKNGFVQFDYQNGRLDRRVYQLNAVSINKVNADNTSILLKKYTFNYSYFNSGGNDIYNNRLKLDQINILDKNSQNVSSYSFGYNLQTRLPAYTNPNNVTDGLGVDYWGYYNGVTTNTTSIPSLPPISSSNFGGGNYNTYEPANRNPNEIYMQANMLQQITYPTGGTTVFAFEGNKDAAGNLMGGIRIKTITSTASATATPIIKKYIYGSPVRLSTVGIAGAYQYSQTYATGFNVLQTDGTYLCQPIPNHDRTVYFGSYPWPLSEHNGSPVVYNSVQEYTDGGTGPSLRTDRQYDIETDRDYTINCPRESNIYFADRSWARANLAFTDYYIYQNGSYSKLKEIEDVYTSLKTGTVNTGLKVFEAISFEGCLNNYLNADYSQTRGYFYYFDDLVDYGIKKLYSRTTTEYDSNQTPTVTNTTQYSYSSNYHLYPTQEVGTDSKGANLTTTTKYVPDLTLTGAAETARQQLLTANNVSPVLQQTVQTGSTPITSSAAYNTFNGNAYLNTVTKKYYNRPVFTEYSYTKYDSHGNLTEYQKLNGLFTAMIWGYKGSLLTANAINAKANDIFFESFEDGNGTSSVEDARTGHYSYSGISSSYSKALSGLDAGTYTLSYWLKSGTAWTLQTQQVTVSGSTYTISISGQIDDVRFYPANAEMTTYTYDPLVGVTSTTDAKGMVTYYEYDSFQRLMNIRDKDRNIVKSFCYNYAGQPTNCYIKMPSYTNAPLPSSFTTSCSGNYTGSVVQYIVPSGKYTSNVSQADADNMATQDAAANGQAYANAHGTCTQNTSFVITNNTGAGYQINFTGPFNLTYNFSNNGTQTIQVPIGTYSVSIYPTGAYNPHTISLTGQTTQTGVPRYTFSNVVISTSTTLTALIY